MFRNWLNGSRDLYVMKSDNGGQTFSDAQKMGMDTWKLNGCPMDGGGVRIAPSNVVQTAWQRKGDIYYAKAGDPEIFIARGRTCSIAGTAENAIITYQNNDTLNVVTLPQRTSRVIGTGGFLKAAHLSAKDNFFVWEQDNKIKYRTL
jgi:hypothetical protein